MPKNNNKLEILSRPPSAPGTSRALEARLRRPNLGLCTLFAPQETVVAEDASAHLEPKERELLQGPSEAEARRLKQQHDEDLGHLQRQV